MTMTRVTKLAHLPDSDALFFSGTSLMALSGLVLAAVLVAWLVGGSEFKDSFDGNAAIVVSFAAMIVGAVMDYLAKRRRYDKE
jgi:phage-related holin